MKNYTQVIPAPVKVGNIKIGLQRLGNPISTQTLLVTKPTKNGNENFTIMPGFNPMGEESISVTVPFDRPDFNFRVGYTTFLTINGLDYIAFAAEIGDLIVAKPIHMYRQEAPIVSLGVLGKRNLVKYEMKYMGFLQVELLNDTFGIGEVFYFKTASKHSIQAIQSQLAAMYSMTGTRLSGLKMSMKAVTKDIHGKQVTFVSLSSTRQDLESFVLNRSNSLLDYSVRDEQYQEQLEYQEEQAIDISNDSSYVVKIDNSYTETTELKERKIKKESDIKKAASFLADIKNTKVPAPTALRVLEKYNWDLEKVKELITTDTTMIEVIKL